MLCTKCGKRTAAVHLKQWVNGQEIEKFLCEECAEAENVWSFGTLDLNKLFSNSFGRPAQMEAPPSCPGCGMSLAEFNSTGRLGCSHCYEVFGEQLRPVIAKFHGERRHVGKRLPGRLEVARLAQDPELAEKNYQRLALQKQLEELVKAERFEEAAKVRDQIRAVTEEIEKGMDSGKPGPEQRAGEQQ